LGDQPRGRARGHRRLRRQGQALGDPGRHPRRGEDRHRSARRRDALSADSPTDPGARLESLDVLRGAALLGVFVENAQHFFAPTHRQLVALPGAGLADHAALWLIEVACENKVYALFALLFGYGIALQMARTGARFTALHLWRMGILFLIGVFHQTYLWSGDILATYALLGVLLLPFRRLATRTLARAAGLALAAPALGLAALLATGAGAPGSETVLAAGYPARQACFAFAMFLLGLAAGRARGAAADPARALGRWLPALLGVGIAGSIAYVALGDPSGGPALAWTGVLAEALIAIAAPALALGYAALLLRLLESPGWRRALAPLAAAGRLSLTNYLAQSLIGAFLLARLGVVHPPLGIAISCAVFALQVLASRWWLARFRFGPVEWLWRALSYGKLPPLRA
jgi:uncharacterized protein